MEPAERTAAVEEPVIMPGNMMMSMIKTSKTAGNRQFECKAADHENTDHHNKSDHVRCHNDVLLFKITAACSARPQVSLFV